MGWNRKTFLGILFFFFLAIVVILTTGNFSKESYLRPWYQVTESLGGVCEQISREDRDHCYQYIARFSGNGLLCGKIEGAGPMSKCRIYIAEWWKKGYLVWSTVTSVDRKWLLYPLWLYPVSGCKVQKPQIVWQYRTGYFSRGKWSQRKRGESD